MPLGGATTLKCINLREQAGILAMITGEVCWLDILFCMGARTRNGYHMVKREAGRAITQPGINGLIADVAMIAITLYNASKIHLFGRCQGKTGTAATEGTGNQEPVTWLPAPLPQLCSVLFQVRCIVMLMIDVFCETKSLTIFLPISLPPHFTAISAFCPQPIMFCLIWREIRAWFLRRAPITPLVTGLNNGFIAMLTGVLPTLISTVLAILASSLISPLRKRVSIKGIHRLFNVASPANDRGDGFTYRGILDVGMPFLSTALIPANYAPILIAALIASFPVKLVKGFFDVAKGAFLRRKQRGLNDLIRFSHSYGPPDQVCSLGEWSADNASFLEHLCLIIPQNPFRSQLNVLFAGDWRASCH